MGRYPSRSAERSFRRICRKIRNKPNRYIDQQVRLWKCRTAEPWTGLAERISERLY